MRFLNKFLSVKLETRGMVIGWLSMSIHVFLVFLDVIFLIHYVANRDYMKEPVEKQPFAVETKSLMEVVEDANGDDMKKADEQRFDIQDSLETKSLMEVLEEVDEIKNVEFLIENETLRNNEKQTRFIFLVGLMWLAFAVSSCVCIKAIETRNHCQLLPMMICLAIYALYGFKQIFLFTFCSFTFGLVFGVLFSYLFILIFSLFETFRHKEMNGFGEKA